MEKLNILANPQKSSAFNTSVKAKYLWPKTKLTFFNLNSQNRSPKKPKQTGSRIDISLYLSNVQNSKLANFHSVRARANFAESLSERLDSFKIFPNPTKKEKIPLAARLGRNLLVYWTGDEESAFKCFLSNVQ